MTKVPAVRGDMVIAQCAVCMSERQAPEMSSKPSQLESYKHEGKFGKCI